MGYVLKSVIEISEIYSILYYDLSYNYHFVGESHDFWEMVYVDQGSAQARRNDEEITVHAGEIILHEPGEIHGIGTEENQNAHVLILTFSSMSQALPQYLKNAHFKCTDKMYHYLKLIYEQSEACFLGCRSTEAGMIFTPRNREDVIFGSEQLLKSHIQELLITFIQHLIENQGQAYQGVAYPEFIDEARVIILQHIGEKELSSRLEKELGLSKRSIQYRFQQEVGITLTEYVRELRLEKGKELLRERLLTVTEIADILGYSSVHYFSAQFKKYNEMSPTEYQKALKHQRHPLTYSKGKANKNGMNKVIKDT